MTGTIENPQVIAGMFEPRKRYSISEWAIRAPFEIAEKGATQPGPYDLGLTPYWREPLDAAGDPEVRWLNIVKSPQSGGTKMAEVVITWYLRHRPGNVLYIRPAEPDIDEAFRDRFRAVFERNLPDLIPPRGEWVVLSKNQRIELTTALVYGAAATVPRQITSRTSPLIFYDETDTGGDTHNDLGNVLDLADERQAAVSAAMTLTLGVSSPKLDTGSNYLAYANRSDARRYWEPCPHCGHYQPLEWDAFVTVDGERDPITIVEEKLARYVCPGCKSHVGPEWQGWMADRGVWVPRDGELAEPLPMEDDEVRDRLSLAVLPDGQRWEPKRSGEWRRNPHRGYLIWAANTKFEQRSWNHMMARWFEVAASKDPERLQVFLNSWRAEPWRRALMPAADESAIRQRVGAYEPRVVPSRAKLILGAVDIQADRVIYGFRAFGPDQESWRITEGAYEVSRDDYGSALDAVYRLAVTEGWPIKGAEDDRMRVLAIAVDSGFRTDEAYEFARRSGVIAIKGEDVAKYRVRLSQVEGKKRPDPVDLYHLNMRVFKDRLQRLMKQPADESESGGWWLHADVTEDDIEQLASEELRPRQSNKRIYTWQLKQEGRPNHMLDVEAYILGLTEAMEQRREASVMALLPSDPALGVFRRGAPPRSASKPVRRRYKSGGWGDAPPIV